MRTKLKLSYAIHYLVMTIILISCSHSNKADILVGTEKCKPPCWIDINPGVTKREEMISILTEREQKGGGSFTLLDSGIARWQSTDGYNSYIYVFDNGLISNTEVDLRSTSINLDDVITIFGEPSKLDIGKISGGYFFATIFYPERGLAFVLGGNKFEISAGTKNFPIDSGMVVVKGVFFQPLDIESMVNLLYGAEVIPQALSDIQDWNGYGTYIE